MEPKAMQHNKKISQEESDSPPNFFDKILRAETNIERFPIWSTKIKRGTVVESTKTIILAPETLPDGGVVERKIEIIPSAKYGYPTVQGQDYWYAVLTLWHDSLSQDSGKLDFSRRDIISGILGKKYGRDQRRSLELALLQFAYTGFGFHHLFYDKKKEITHKEVSHFHLITDLRLTERNESNIITQDKCSLTLHPLIVSNLQAGYFKPVLLSVVCRLQSDIAKLLYRKLDFQFSHYTKYEISTERFFQETGIFGKKYKTPSGRKQILEKGVKELIGKPTSSGTVISSYQFLPKVSGNDIKIIILGDKGEKVQAAFKKSNTEKTEEPLKSNEVLAYFQKKFHGNECFVNSSKVVTQSEKIVKQLGVNKTKKFIDHAYEQANKTGYNPQTFNGIINYLPSWIQKQEELEKIEARDRRLKKAREEAEATKTKNAHHLLKKLSIEEREALFKEANRSILILKSSISEEHYRKAIEIKVIDLIKEKYLTD